mmetsp:Transcript_1093/g.2500  ORF Transcript_1093/g.2500 Transcript_1093/m.2500 type:complete len:675 (+) Transcript_1093:3561-5585(+)
MRDVAKWEAALKKAFDTLRNEDRTQILESVSHLTVAAFRKSDALLDQAGVRRFLDNNLTNFILELKAKGMLPAICFFMSQRGCETLADRLRGALLAEEQKYRANTGWATKLSDLKQQYEAMKAKFERQVHTGTKDEIEQSKREGKCELEKIECKIKSLQRADPKFTLFSCDNVLTEAEIDDAVGERELQNEGYEWLRLCMLRGIAVHHAGMNKRWRMAVEHLFRKRRLAVVFGTATLSMGINMPCKTSVFVSDAVYINSMSYRQMAGRAGRRGFDLRGNVVFFGMRSPKIARLIKSELPVLQGNQLLSSTTVLRLIMMHVHSVGRASASSGQVVGAVARCVTLPFFRPSHLTSQQNAHAFRFCFEYLCREGLLIPQPDENGVTNMAVSDVAGLITHLHYTEPSNFAFLSLLTSGLLSDLCEDFNCPKADVNRELRLVLVLCHLFNRRPLSPHLETLVSEKRITGPSIVQLPELDQKVRDTLNGANERALKTFCDYLMCFSRAYKEELGLDDMLPFSRVRCGATEDAFGSAKVPPELLRLAQSVSMRSNFVALSGHGDDTFRTVTELCATLRRGLHMDPAMLPVLPEANGPLNSYLFDFYKHGQQQALVRFNGLQRESLWEGLRDFELVLRAIAAAMRWRYDKNYDVSVFHNTVVVEALEDIAREFSSKLSAMAS